MKNLIYCPECGCKLIPDGNCMFCPNCSWDACYGVLPSTEEIIRQQKMIEEEQDDYRDEN